MSRTDKDMPYRIQEADGRRFSYAGYRGGRQSRGQVVGGMWRGIHHWNRAYWGSVRAHERVALARGAEPEPAHPRHCSRWRIY